MRRLLLVRHPLVCESLKGICYGISDVPLSPAGLQQIPVIITNLLAEGTPTHIFQSGLLRTQQLAEALSAATGTPAMSDPRLQERSFGDWELRSWNDIYQETGDVMTGMITSPDKWSPPKGETTFQMRDRVLKWYSELPQDGLLVAITHGGPIAALRGSLLNRSVEQWIELIPVCGEIVAMKSQL